TGRWGLRCPRMRSWPDRSALASTMRELVLQEPRTPLSAVGGFVPITRARLGCLTLGETTIGGLDVVGDGCHRDDRRKGRGRFQGGISIKAKRKRHETPPRAAREKPGTGSGDPASERPKLPSRDRTCTRPAAHPPKHGQVQSLPSPALGSQDTKR